MNKVRVLKAASLLLLLACAACAPNNSLMISGYDAEGARTGTMLPTPGTLTPY